MKWGKEKGSVGWGCVGCFYSKKVKIPGKRPSRWKKLLVQQCLAGAHLVCRSSQETMAGAEWGRGRVVGSDVRDSRGPDQPALLGLDFCFPAWGENVADEGTTGWYIYLFILNKDYFGCWIENWLWRLEQSWAAAAVTQVVSVENSPWSAIGMFWSRANMIGWGLGCQVKERIIKEPSKTICLRSVMELPPLSQRRQSDLRKMRGSVLPSLVLRSRLDV